MRSWNLRQGGSDPSFGIEAGKKRGRGKGEGEGGRGKGRRVYSLRLLGTVD